MMRGRVDRSEKDYLPLTFAMNRPTSRSSFTPPRIPGGVSVLAHEPDPRLPGEVILRGITEGV